MQSEEHRTLEEALGHLEKQFKQLSLPLSDVSLILEADVSVINPS